jgi:hypothetical protein
MEIVATRVEIGQDVQWHVTDSPPLLKRIMKLLHLSLTLYVPHGQVGNELDELPNRATIAEKRHDGHAIKVPESRNRDIKRRRLRTSAKRTTEHFTASGTTRRSVSYAQFRNPDH